MNLRDKVGQRFMLSFEGLELTPQLSQWLLDCRAGGVILFGHNIKSLEQVTALNRDLQDLAARNGLPPFIIALDEEGGRVSRMPGDGQSWIAPSQMAQAAAGIEAVRACAGVIARRIQRLGFNLTFTPVSDVNNNPANPVIGSRSYGSDPQQVAEAVAAAVEVYNAAGMGSCVKHFPGHGDTEVDSHLGLPFVNHNRARLDEVELVPFRRAFAARVPALMTAHIIYPQFEPEVPATMSRKFLVEILREELGYQGLVFTDALVMKAIADRYSPYDASLTTLKAGADIALPCTSMEVQRATISLISSAAEQGEFEIEQGLARILAFKERFCKPAPTGVSLETLNQEAEDARQILDAARRSITLVSREEGFEFGKAPDRPAVIDFTLPMASFVEEGRQPGPLLRSALLPSWPYLRYFKLAADPQESEVALALELVRSSDYPVVILRNARRLPAQAKALQALIEANPAVVLVAARDPYDLTLAPVAAAKIATYGDPPCSMLALAEVLTGRLNASGKLPVELE